MKGMIEVEVQSANQHACTIVVSGGSGKWTKFVWRGLAEEDPLGLDSIVY